MEDLEENEEMEDADKKGNYTEGAENVIDNTAQE